MMYHSRALHAGTHHASVEWTSERVYMREIRLWERLPEDILRWDSLVWAMTSACGIRDNLTAYLMVDQTVAGLDGMTRRPGWHIDGYWDPGVSAHSPGHRPRPSHVPAPSHGSGGDDWSSATFEEPEGIVLWSDVGALVAWNGEFEGPIEEGGAVSGGAALGGGHSLLQPDGGVVCGNVTMLHETTPVAPGTRRTVVRMNVPGWTPCG